MEYICVLDPVLPTTCCFYHQPKSHCLGNNCCAFCQEDVSDDELMKSKYVRKERWYEKYYK